ncbi:four helix bundle protein [Gracilimonas sp.]|uniref:four helix bundle protein n=1 Tax=Gracilimonas sp. TaxID=1974203 RepID=UPI0028715E86|nr:four helix bundle protein [Gracilimonas sp.]
MKNENIVLDKSFNFALSIIGLYKVLIKHKEYVLSKQLLRSATSIGANIEEATAASSKKDFAHKMTISSKEARETRYWLKLLDKSQIVQMDYSSYIHNVNELVKILTAIVKTSQKM